ncbi:hypothetical protein EFR84_33980 [Rhizobium chutanense]|uniref:Uncharacterized protein n=1 Tax=Rhizobium chutanense TaxID=2035448 RepID=A0A432N7M2_9HYPH|nr:hypothetical protein EFR84_33980 [Rhizobium chutanense]
MILVIKAVKRKFSGSAHTQESLILRCPAGASKDEAGIPKKDVMESKNRPICGKNIRFAQRNAGAFVNATRH